MFAEGFFPHHVTESGLEISLEDIDFSNWPNMTEVSRMAAAYNSDEESDEEGDPPNQLYDEVLDQIMRDLTVTIIAVDKRSSQSSMVIAQSDFAGTGSRSDGGIDNMGGHGFCWPRGEMSLHSHGAVETRRTANPFSGNYDYDNKDPSSKLGMLFNTVTWSDPNDSSRVIRKECIWTLQISLDNVERGVDEEDHDDDNIDTEDY
jgi:hypothetical protein